MNTLFICRLIITLLNHISCNFIFFYLKRYENNLIKSVINRRRVLPMKCMSLILAEFFLFPPRKISNSPQEKAKKKIKSIFMYFKQYPGVVFLRTDDPKIAYTIDCCTFFSSAKRKKPFFQNDVIDCIFPQLT